MSYHVYDTYAIIQGNTEGEKGQSRRVWHAAFHRLCSQVALHHRRHHHQHCHHRCHQLAIRWLLEPFLRHRHHHYHIILTGGLKQQVRQNLSLSLSPSYLHQFPHQSQHQHCGHYCGHRSHWQHPFKISSIVLSHDDKPFCFQPKEVTISSC